MKLKIWLVGTLFLAIASGCSTQSVRRNPASGESAAIKEFTSRLVDMGVSSDKIDEVATQVVRDHARTWESPPTPPSTR